MLPSSASTENTTLSNCKLRERHCQKHTDVTEIGLIIFIPLTNRAGLILRFQAKLPKLNAFIICERNEIIIWRATVSSFDSDALEISSDGLETGSDGLEAKCNVKKYSFGRRSRALTAAVSKSVATVSKGITAV